MKKTATYFIDYKSFISFSGWRYFSSPNSSKGYIRTKNKRKYSSEWADGLRGMAEYAHRLWFFQTVLTAIVNQAVEICLNTPLNCI
ncbi:MAG: hypothetical protein CFE21_21830 [Bacteroidetes bacterium B1(2017)]|nr:MAG: hypothetical protein CFE21_21830 [Bacteroidetes bacterium B1(2017)]